MLMTSLASEILASLLLLLGSFFALGAGMGVLRMPDFFTRLLASGKAATLGAILLSFGTAVYFNDVHVWIQCLMIIVFFLVTAPMAAHLLGRAAYESGVPYRGEDGKTHQRGKPIK
jgi:multicomponent Na+:H+ antiporter subunit G